MSALARIRHRFDVMKQAEPVEDFDLEALYRTLKHTQSRTRMLAEQASARGQFHMAARMDGRIEGYEDALSMLEAAGVGSGR